MSKRKTNIIAFHFSSGIFKSFEEAVKEANAIKIWLGRLCEKKGYSCKAIIGISKHNPRAGSITTHKSGCKGRPTTVFKRTSTILLPTTTEPHIHIVLFANPCDMISALLSKHLNSKYKHKVCRFNNCSHYVNEAVLYVIKQSLKIRKLEYDPPNILSKDDLGFYSAVNSANAALGSERVLFTYEEPTKELKIIDVNSILKAIQNRKELQCNKNYIYRTNKVYIIYIPYTYFKRLNSYLIDRLFINISILYRYLVYIKIIPP